MLTYRPFTVEPTLRPECVLDVDKNAEGPAPQVATFTEKFDMAGEEMSKDEGHVHEITAADQDVGMREPIIELPATEEQKPLVTEPETQPEHLVQVEEAAEEAEEPIEVQPPAPPEQLLEAAEEEEKEEVEPSPPVAPTTEETPAAPDAMEREKTPSPVPEEEEKQGVEGLKEHSTLKREAPPETPKSEPRAKRKKVPSPQEQGESPFMVAIKEIPSGSTRTFAEVASAAEKPNASSTVGKLIKGLNLPGENTIPWWRVVGNDGRLRTGEEGVEQLTKLREEGARPKDGETVLEWASRVAADVVGCYGYGTQKCVFAEHTDPTVDKFNSKRVEKFASVTQAEERGWVLLADQEIEE